MGTRTRIGLGVAAVAVALGVGGGAYVTAQDQPADPSRAERHGPGRFGGSGRFGGPGGQGGPGMFRGRGGPIGLPLGRLQLTDSQRQQVQTIRQSHEDELRGIGERARQARQALETAIAADTFDEGLIRTRAGELAQVETEMTVVQARIRHDVVQQVLTEEQRAKLKRN